MLNDTMDIKDIYIVGENLREMVSEEMTVFTGQNLVDWIMKNEGQVGSREEGLKLGRYLVEYRIIHHVEDKYHFLDDSNKSYRFCTDTEVYPRKATERQTWVQGLTVMRYFAQEVDSAKKRRKSWKPFMRCGPSSHSFKGKHLMDWLEKNADFESRDECRRFFKSLLKLNFIRSSQNDLKFCENTEYWFYVTRLKEDGSKMRRLSRTLLPDRRQLHQKEETSPTGITTSLLSLLASHETVGTEDRRNRLSLRRTCSVLRSSLSRSSLGASSHSLARSNSSGSEGRSRVVMRSGDGENSRSSSRDSLDCSVSMRSARNSTCEIEACKLPLRGHQVSLKQIRAQLAMQRSRCSQSESSTGSVSDLIESPDFQKILNDIGKSSSQKNIKQLEEGRRTILCQLEARKYGKPCPISPSNSCPQNLGSIFKRGVLTSSARFGSISDQSISSSSSSEDEVTRDLSISRDLSTSRDSVCSTPIALSQFEYPAHSGMCERNVTCPDTSSLIAHEQEIIPKHIPDTETLKKLVSRAVCSVTATTARRARLKRTCTQE